MAAVEFYELYPGEKFAYKIVNRNGKAPGIFMIGGWSAVMEDWEELPVLLSQGDRPVMLFDNRGLGKSVVTKGPYNMTQIATDAYEMAKQVFLPLNPSGFHVLGISMGGMITQTIMAEKDIPFVLSAILGCTAPGISSVHPSSETIIAMTQPDPSWTKEQKARSALAVCYTPSWIENNQDIFQKFVEKSLLGTRPVRSLIAQSSAIGDFYITQPKRIKKATLIIHGTEDFVLPYDNAIVLHEQLKNVPENTVELVTMPEIGHIFWNMAMDETTKIILNFITKHDTLSSKL